MRIIVWWESDKGKTRRKQQCRRPQPLGSNADDLKRRLYNNNRNKEHKKCNTLESSPNHPSPTSGSWEKLPPEIFHSLVPERLGTAVLQHLAWYWVQNICPINVRENISLSEHRGTYAVSTIPNDVAQTLLYKGPTSVTTCPCLLTHAPLQWFVTPYIPVHWGGQRQL